MAETEKTLVEAGKEVMEATAPDAPKKNAVPAEPSPLKNDAEDLGAAVVKPTDSNPDATKKVKQVSGDAQQKSQGAADPMPKLDSKMPGKAMEETEAEEGSEEIKEGEMPAGLKKYLDKKNDKSEEKEDEKKDVKEVADKEKEMKKESDDEKKKDMKEAEDHKDEKKKEESYDDKKKDVKEDTVSEAEHKDEKEVKKELSYTLASDRRIDTTFAQCYYRHSFKQPAQPVVSPHASNSQLVSHEHQPATQLATNATIGRGIAENEPPQRHILKFAHPCCRKSFQDLTVLQLLLLRAIEPTTQNSRDIASSTLEKQRCF